MNPDLFDGIEGLARVSTGGRPPHTRLVYGLAPGLSAHAVRAVAEALMRRLPEGVHMDFFDVQYPSMSDPGGYLTLLRLAGGGLRLSVANHGWSSGWMPISDVEAADYLARCLADDTPEPFVPPPSNPSAVVPRLSVFGSPCRWPGDGRGADALRVYLTGRLAADG